MLDDDGLGTEDFDGFSPRIGELGQANLIDLFGWRPDLLAVAERFQYASQLWLSRQLVNSQSTRWQEGILLKNPPSSFETVHAEPSRSILRLFQQNQEGLPDP
jgi:hypothetical protein